MPSLIAAMALDLRSIPVNELRTNDPHRSGEIHHGYDHICAAADLGRDPRGGYQLVRVGNCPFTLMDGRPLQRWMSAIPVIDHILAIRRGRFHPIDSFPEEARIRETTPKVTRTVNPTHGP